MSESTASSPLASSHGDLLLVSLYLAVAAVAVLARGTLPGVVMVAIGTPLVTVVPGYAVVAATFPGTVSRGKPRRDPLATESESLATGSPRVGRSASSWLSADAPSGISVLERFGLAVVLSFVAVASVGLVAALSPWGLSAVTVLVGTVGLTAAGLVVARARRNRLPPTDRFGVSLRAGGGRLRAVAPDSLRGWVLVLVVCVSLLAATGAVGLAWTETESGTGFYLLSENDDGDLVAGDYPSELEPGESTSLVTAVENHGSQEVQYAVVVTSERIDADANGSTEATVVDRYRESVAPGVRWTHRHSVAGEQVTDDFRLRYYLYRGSAPEQPSSGEPLQRLQLTVDVEADS